MPVQLICDQWAAASPLTVLDLRSRPLRPSLLAAARRRAVQNDRAPNGVGARPKSMWESREGEFLFLDLRGAAMSRKLDLTKMEGAFKRAAQKALHGTRAERSGRFLLKRRVPSRTGGQQAGPTKRAALPKQA